MFRYTTRNNKFTGYEGSSAFYIVDNESGKEACIGDGVDMFTDNDGNSIWVGTDEFYDCFQDLLELDQKTIKEAYFS